MTYFPKALKVFWCEQILQGLLNQQYVRSQLAQMEQEYEEKVIAAFRGISLAQFIDVCYESCTDDLID